MNLRNTQSPAVFFSAIIALLGVALLSVHWMVGGGFIVAGLVTLFLTVRPQSAPRERTEVLPARREVPIQTISSEFEITMDPVPAVPQPVAQEGIAVLLTALRVTGRDLRAPVFYANEVPIPARDIVHQLYDYLMEHEIPVETLVERAPEIYDAFWEFAEEATSTLTSTEDISAYIAACAYEQLTQK